MVPSLMEFTNSQNPNPQINLSPSIQTVVDEIHKENPKLSHLIQQFYHPMQSRVDPTLESIWVYAALTFRSRNHPKGDIFNRFAAAKDLFQLLSSCSASCAAAKAAALLAPVVRLVYDVVLELFKGELGVKKEKKVLKEVKSLVGVIMGFMNVCCFSNEVEFSTESDSGWSFSGLSCVWLDRNEGVGKLLPLVSEEVIGGLSERDGDVSYLAGVVIAEVFLLRMCLNCRGGTASREKLETELRSWAVGSITGFQNVFVFEVLLRMLLEKTLPVTSLVSSEDVVLLRKVLYDAIILVEYSFLNPEKAIHISAEHMKIIAMRRLILAHEAVEYFREHGDQKRIISYTTAFSSSQLYIQIVKWVKSQISVEDSSVKSQGSSPKALIKWLLNLERQGFLVFGDSMLKHHSLDMFKPPASKLDWNGADADPIFYIDNKGQGEHTDDGKVISAAFLAAANTMTSTEKRGKKRKGEDGSESEEESSLSDEDSE